MGARASELCDCDHPKSRHERDQVSGLYEGACTAIVRVHESGVDQCPCGRYTKKKEATR